MQVELAFTSGDDSRDIPDSTWRSDCNLAKKRVKYAPNDFIYLEGSSARQLQWT